jgi:hypothetical protein
MNAIVAALPADPAILRLNPITLASDIRERYGVRSCEAYAAIRDAYQQAADDGTAPDEILAEAA